MKQPWKLAMMAWMLERIDDEDFYRDERHFIVQWFWSLNKKLLTP